MVCSLAFLVVSVALACKFIMEMYLEYIQVKNGIKVFTQKDMQDVVDQVKEDDDDYFSY